MNRKGYIGLLVLTLYVSLVQGQMALDTVCVNGGPSHLAVPYAAGFNYQWSVSGGQIIGRTDTNNIEVQWGSTPGMYPLSLVVTDNNGCVSDTSRAWMLLRGPQRANAKGPAVVCRGELVTLESSLPSGFQWEGGQTQQSISFVADKDTTVMLIAINGSCGNDTFYHKVNAIDIPISSISYVEDTLQLNEIRKLTYHGSNPQTIEWYLNGQLVSQTASLLINFDGKGAYEVMQVVSNGAHCSDTVKKTIYVVAEFKVWVPNAFTPNGDGVNDYFEFDGIGIKNYTMTVYNRWGEKVSVTNEKSPHGWDGTNSGKESKMDTYTYDLILESTGGEFFQERGQVTLLR